MFQTESELTEVATARSGTRLFNKTFSSFVNNLRLPIYSNTQKRKKKHYERQDLEARMQKHRTKQCNISFHRILNTLCNIQRNSIM